MRWMVGLDVRETSKGAVGFACALHRAGADEVFSALHVIEDRTRVLVEERDPNRLEALSGDLRRLFEPLSEGQVFDDVGVITAATAEIGLREAAASRQCPGMIIGRRGPSRGRALVRLGRTARCALRNLDRPTVVVPPDFADAATLRGPVMLATDLGPTSAGAANFAKELAGSLGVDVLATTVMTVPGELGPYLTGIGEGEPDLRAIQQNLTKWLEDHGLADARSSVVVGSATDKLLEVAEIAGAAVLVVGTRGLSSSERLFVSSLGSHLAAHSPLPVAVVPPRWRR